ncbi:hypothetical protein BZK24_08395, partial [Helicobacter pylori]
MRSSGYVDNDYVFLFHNTDNKDHEFYFKILGQKDIHIKKPLNPIAIKAGRSKNMVVNINQTFTRNPTTEYTYPNGNGNYYSGGSSIPIQLKFNSVNDAKNLLQQAATIMQVLTTQNPHVNGGGGAWGFSGKTGSVVDIFGESFNAINEMIKNAQSLLEKTQQLNANENTQITQPENFNPYTSKDIGFAQE